MKLIAQCIKLVRRTMKRKRNSTQSDDLQTCDLVLIDANGRSIRAHKALLIDKSEYFANLLTGSDLTELQLNEKYLVELIRYLYNHEDRSSLGPHPNGSRKRDEDFADPSILNGDIEVLMQLLVLSRKYGFKQLSRDLKNEINYRLGPTTIVTVYKCARELNLQDLQDSTKLMILSWLNQLQSNNEFLTLSEDSIYDIFGSEALEIESESKLNALSVWWSHNKDADMTNLWAQLITCSYK